MIRIVLLFVAMTLAVAQSKQGIPLPKDSRGVPIAKEVKFEVLSIRPLADASLAEYGSFAEWVHFHAVGLADADARLWPVDAVQWGSVQVLKAPGWIGDFYRSTAACRKRISKAGRVRAASMNCSGLLCGLPLESDSSSRCMRNQQKEVSLKS